MNNEQVHLSYCPDNTCVVFSGKRQYLDQLSDFSLLYLYHISSYVYLTRDMHGNGIFIDKARSSAEQLEENYATTCSEEFAKRLSCVMQGLVNSSSFYVRNVRLDEGGRYFSSLDLEKSLSEENILKIKQEKGTLPFY